MLLACRASRLSRSDSVSGGDRNIHAEDMSWWLCGKHGASHESCVWALCALSCLWLRACVELGLGLAFSLAVRHAFAAWRISLAKQGAGGERKETAAPKFTEDSFFEMFGKKRSIKPPP